ncbi:MAG TPA: DUF1501 domain-containing protein [Pirellulales bacterium]|jgi:hypothetical protein|nr:DUF1501 domain-containing protein [Pirellulales bacterium]
MDGFQKVFSPLHPAFANRRDFLRRAGSGAGILALAAMLGQEQLLAGTAGNLPSDGGLHVATAMNPLAPKPGHFPGKAKAVIWLFINGGPSHVDTWDYKPALAKRDGEKLKNFDPTTGFFQDQVGPIMRSPFEFKQHGQCGAWVSSIFPHMAKHVDKMAFLYSCWTDTNNHAPALLKMNTGMARLGFPCVGSWVTYGLGSESQDLPSFVVMYDTLGRGMPKGYSENWSAGFLPGVFQGTALKHQGAPIDNLDRSKWMSDRQQRAQLDLIARLNRRELAQHAGEGDLAARIDSFELAYRMQMAAPEALDLNRETAATQKMYGLDNPKCGHFARQCMIARRMVERGVRFVQIYSGGEENQRSWDGHIDIRGNHSGFAAETDQPIAALLEDLQARGLLDSTLVVWGGEFGRLPLAQKGANPGRDHNPHAFTTWMAGGGVRGGTFHGQTDEIGHKAAVDKVSINDLHATILHLLGIDHKRLLYRYNGRDYRLTDVAGEVVRDILA